jgi:hypothetical protein
MAKGYVYSVFPNDDGEVEVLDFSVSGAKDMYCPDCEAVKHHALAAISSIRGPMYICAFCGCEHTEEGGDRNA